MRYPHPSDRTRARGKIGRSLLTAAVMLGMTAASGQGAATAGRRQANELAERRFQTGLVFAQDGSYTEALTDFEAVVDLYPASPVADNALLEIARSHLEVTERLDLAAAYANRIVDDTSYSQEDAAPEAYILLARIAMARGHTSENLDAALAQLQRGVGLWPDAATVPQALFLTGEVHRRAGRFDAALEAYRRVIADHVFTTWAARAGLESGVLLAVAEDPVSAMVALQRVRDRWPDSPEAEVALERISILYRLYVRSPDRAFALGGELLNTRGMRRIRGLLVDGQGDVYYATDRMVGQADPAAVPWPPAGDRPRALVADRFGEMTAIVRGTLVQRATAPVQLLVPRPGEEPKELREIDAAGVTAAGDWLVMDRDERQIHRFSSAGGYRGVFAQGRATRLAVGPHDQVAVVGRDDRVRLLEGPGSQEIPREGPSYEIDDPIAVAFDPFGHLYVVDEKRVFIFGHDRQLLRQFPASNDVPDAPRKITAFALDRFGGLVIADDDTHQIVRYH